MTRFLLAALVAALLATTAATDTATAGGYPYATPYLYGASPYIYHGTRYDIPYFSLYPPVYYSQPVARPYGFSPFAAPFGPIPEVVVEPEIIKNPHVEAEPTTTTSDSVARHPGLVRNPYVQVSHQSAGESDVADRLDQIVAQIEALPDSLRQELAERLAE